jgi:hypothetical protein
MKHSNNHTFTSDKLTDKILAKMERLKINRSMVIRNLLKSYYFKEIRPLELRNRHESKRKDCPF